VADILAGRPPAGDRWRCPYWSKRPRWSTKDMMTLAQIRNLGLTEILIILIVLILLFGARKIPDLARALGKSLGEFKKGREEGGRDDEAGAKSGKNGSDTK
jgi:sec-independent protein translocase protein TatA